jgi:mannose-6-phosphate isomerase-like protein (cupin superfamily)
MEGELVITYPDREEEVRAGQVFYSPPGHSVRHTEMTRMLELSPLHEWNSTMSAWRANAESG